MKEDEPYLLHILDAIEKIKDACKGISKGKFVENELVREYTIRKMEIIGEAVKHISKETREKGKGIKWKMIAGTRDKLIHHYMGIDYSIIWDVVEHELPILEGQVKELLKEQK